MSRRPNFDVTGAWLEGDDPGDRKFIKIGFLLLENGETCQISPSLIKHGERLNADKVQCNFD